MYDPVLDVQAAMNGGALGVRQMDARTDSVLSEITGTIDSTPRFVGGLVLGSLATLVLLKVAGFRFSFGVGVGGG